MSLQQPSARREIVPEPKDFKHMCVQVMAGLKYSVRCPEDALRAIREVEDRRERLVKLKAELEKERGKHARTAKRKGRRYRPRSSNTDIALMESVEGIIWHAAQAIKAGGYAYEAQRIDNAIEGCDNAIIQFQAYLYRNPPGSS